MQEIKLDNFISTHTAVVKEDVRTKRNRCKINKNIIYKGLIITFKKILQRKSLQIATLLLWNNLNLTDHRLQPPHTPPFAPARGGDRVWEACQLSWSLRAEQLGSPWSSWCCKAEHSLPEMHQISKQQQQHQGWRILSSSYQHQILPSQWHNEPIENIMIIKLHEKVFIK